MKGRKKLIVNIVVGLVCVFCILMFYSTFSMDLEYVFESEVYEIGDNNYITGISANTTVELYSKYFDMDNCSIEIFDKDNKQIVSGFVLNGSKTILYDSNHNVINSYVNIVSGDYNSDGLIDMNDFYEMGKCLVNSCSLEEYLMFSVDVDLDKEFHLNDLMLIDKAVTLGYSNLVLNEDNIVLQSKEIKRVVAKVTPNYGVNLNVNWSSENADIASVDEVGRITGNKVGETIIRATTLDGKYSEDVVVRVDNTIQLSSYDGIGYIGGNDIKVAIKSIDYDGITCSVGNTSIASCEIVDNNLLIKSIAEGKTEVRVNSSIYGEVIYNLEVRSVYFNIMPKYICEYPNKAHLLTVSGFNSGDLSFESENTEIVAGAGMQMYNGRNMLKINMGSKQGRTVLKVRESNGNSVASVVIDVTSMSLADMGKETIVGKEVSSTIISGNLGNAVTCKSNDLSKATCRIEGNQLIVTPLATGAVTVDVYNNFNYEGSYEKCGQAQLIVVIQR